MTSHSIEDYRTRNEDAPLYLVRESEDWKPVARLIDGWAKESLGATSGYSSQELDHFSRTHGVRFPPVLREWWRLAGRHAFVEIGLLPGNARLLAPHYRWWLIRNRDFLMITVDDTQTGSGNGIHADFLSEPNPEIYGINGTIGPDEVPELNWYKGEYLPTGLRLPAIIFATLLCHLFEPSPLVRDEAVYLEVESEPLDRRPNERLVLNLNLKCFPNDTMVGDIYSDGEDIIYWWMLGCVCRTAEAADRVRQLVPTRPRT